MELSAESREATVAVDGSARSRAAVDWAVERAYRGTRNLRLITVIDEVVGVQEPHLQAQLARRADEFLQAERARVAQNYPSITVATELVYGGVAHALKRASAQCDLLVVGTHKNGLLRQAILGSLGIRMARIAACSVAVIPETVPAGSAVVVGLDSTDQSRTAAEFAAADAAAMGSELVMVCVGYAPNPLYSDLIPPTLPAEERAEILARTSEHLLRLFPQLAIQTRSEEGSPQKVLLQASQDARLLVVGHHDRSAVTQLFEGSVAHGVLVGMSTPVVIVRAKSSPRREPIESAPASDARA
ncbi:universal stress protein [Rathayibacter soli]|uniref:universal stress protein n=1 Tax=Rathayibacter soli TaxID=3144168 RepID=UPI0027E45746|nr:universal stress protein [Glaciibacter superstes]